MNRPNSREQGCRGAAFAAFTLVEMMVVLAVLAVLASLLIPAVARARSAARSAQCKANLHQLGLALRMYVGDFGKYPLTAWPIDPTRGASGPWKDWPHELAPYVGIPVERALSDRSFHCSEHFRAQLPERPVFHSEYKAYGYNESGVGAGGNCYGLGLGNPIWFDPNFVQLLVRGKWLRIETSESKVRQPDDMIAITCSPRPNQWSVGPARYHDEYRPANSHAGGANVLFCDGHVEHGKQAQWIEMTDRARRRWNNDHEPHWGAIR